MNNKTWTGTLQVQVSVLKEEKRNLLRQVDELSKTNSCNESLHRYRSQSFSEQRANLRNLKNAASTPTRDMGTMCGVMTRDVGVSHQQVRDTLRFRCPSDLSSARSTLLRGRNSRKAAPGMPGSSGPRTICILDGRRNNSDS